MCKSNITLRKFLKLLLWMEFYNIVFYLIFTLTGYQEFTVPDMIKALLPVSSVADGFGSEYLLFYLFIPLLNILIKGMGKKQQLQLVVLCVCVYTILPALTIKVVFNYVTWFSVIYLIGSYLRIYPEKWFGNRTVWGVLSILTLLLSWSSILCISYTMFKFTGRINGGYFFIADANKPLALATAICSFMFFKNLNIGYSKFINTVAAASYGVLLIHANSSSMRQWLWNDMLNNAGQYNSNMLIVHAVCSVAGIYIICTIIDIIRSIFIEKPFFKWYDKHLIKK